MSARILGLDNEGLTDFRTQRSRNSGLYVALARRHEIAGTITPRLPVAEETLNRLIHVAPDRNRWRNRADVNPFVFRRRTAHAQRALEERRGTFDIVLQLYLLYAPGTAPRPPHALYLDATLALSLRGYPDAAPLSARARRTFLALEREAYNGAGALFPMSEWVARSLMEDYGCDPARITVAGAGTNVMVETLADKRYDRPVALFVGLDFRRKGGADLLESWTAVRRAVPAAELWVAGIDGEDDAGTGVRYLGRLDRDGVAAAYRDAAVLVLPSHFDPFPHVLREAMGSGVPCVATRQAGVPEIVADGETGLLVAPHDPQDLGRALTELLADPARAAAMGRAAHARVLGSMTWEHVADRMEPGLEALAP